MSSNPKVVRLKDIKRGVWAWIVNAEVLSESGSILKWAPRRVRFTRPVQQCTTFEAVGDKVIKYSVPMIYHYDEIPRHGWWEESYDDAQYFGYGKYSVAGAISPSRFFRKKKDAFAYYALSEMATKEQVDWQRELCKMDSDNYGTPEMEFVPYNPEPKRYKKNKKRHNRMPGKTLLQAAVDLFSAAYNRACASQDTFSEAFFPTVTIGMPTPEEVKAIEGVLPTGHPPRRREKKVTRRKRKAEWVAEQVDRAERIVRYGFDYVR